jgi:hypothetical protein
MAGKDHVRPDSSANSGQPPPATPGGPGTVAGASGASGGWTDWWLRIWTATVQTLMLIVRLLEWFHGRRHDGRPC